jgi:cell division transport system ATP-binding protein
MENEGLIVHMEKCNIFQSEMLVLQDVNVQIKRGEFVYLIGKTGSGKSSFLKTIYGALPIKSGEADVANVKLNTLKRSKAHLLRRKLGMIFQDFLIFQINYIKNLI